MSSRSPGASSAAPVGHVAYIDEPPRTADVVIVGGGIVGAATAFFAARAGLRAVVVERRPRLGTLTTAVASGAFRLQFDDPDELALVREGVTLFEGFAERTGLDGWDLGLRRQGYLFCSLTEETAERAGRIVDLQRSWGLDDVELLDGDEAHQRFPYLSRSVRQARYRAGDGWLDAAALTHGYLAAAGGARIPDGAAGGDAVVLTDTEVTGFLGRSGERVTGVRTSRGDIAAESVVLATGPFLGRTAAVAGLPLDLRPTTRQRLTFPVLPEVPPDAPMTIEDETAVHWRPALAGGCYCLWTDPRAPSSDPVDSPPTDPAWAFRILDPRSSAALARVSTFWQAIWERGAPGWLLSAGQYEYTPDHRPYLGPTGIEGLHVNGGYSGHGVMGSAGGSRLVIDLLTGQAEPAANRFRVDRQMTQRERDVL